MLLDKLRIKVQLELVGLSRQLEISKVFTKERLVRWSCSPQNSWSTVMEPLTPPTSMLIAVSLVDGLTSLSNTLSRPVVSTQRLNILIVSVEALLRNHVSPVWLKDSLKNCVDHLSLGVMPLNGLAERREASMPSRSLIGLQSRRMRLKSLSNWSQLVPFQSVLTLQCCSFTGRVSSTQPSVIPTP